MPGEPDADYRIRLKAYAPRLARSGEVETLVDLWATISGADYVEAVEYYPGSIQLYAHTPIAGDVFTADQDSAAIEQFEKIAAAGVALSLMFVEAQHFEWGSSADASAAGDLNDSTWGFGDASEADASGDLPGAAGGKFARVL